MTTYTIEIACDHTDKNAFCNWLNNQGNNAEIGNTTGNYINGICTSTEPEANEIMNNLWDNYCADLD